VALQRRDDPFECARVDVSADPKLPAPPSSISITPPAFNGLSEEAGGGNATVTGMNADDEGGAAGLSFAVYKRFQRNKRLGAIP
jgi:hypothetical protein